MNYRTVSILTLGICVLLLTLASPSMGNDAVASSAHEGLIDTGVNTLATAVTTLGSTVQSEMASSWACLPQYSEAEEILILYPPTDLHHVVSADFNGDGWPDAVLARAFWQSDEIFELDILLNDGDGNLGLGTSQPRKG